MRKFILILSALLIPLMPLAVSAHDHDDDDRWEHGEREWHHHHWWHHDYYVEEAPVYYQPGYYYPRYYYPAPAPVVVAPQPVYAAPPVFSIILPFSH